MHPQLARCHVKPRHLEDDQHSDADQRQDPSAPQSLRGAVAHPGGNAGGNGDAKLQPDASKPVIDASSNKKVKLPPPSSHLHVSAVRLWMSLLSGVFGDGLGHRRRRQQQPQQSQRHNGRSRSRSGGSGGGGGDSGDGEARITIKLSHPDVKGERSHETSH